MIIRSLKGNDISILREINERCHPNDAFPSLKNFCGEFLVITDNEDHIISAGGVELVAEAITITDRKFSSFQRANALKELLKHMLRVCEKIGQDHLLAHNNDAIHTRALKVAGFKPVGNEAFFLEVSNG